MQTFRMPHKLTWFFKFLSFLKLSFLGFSICSANPTIYKDYQNQYPGWQFIQVPQNYNNRDSTAKTWLSYKTSAHFDPHKPSILWVNGGPGGSSLNYQMENLLEDFNFIYFNQRGTGFSFPDSVIPTQDQRNFYSSRNTALDMNELLDHLALSKVIVYAHSYGTIPASIFASLFPERSEKLILEGTVYRGDQQLWNSPHRRKLIQNFFDRLSPEMKTKIQFYSQLPGLNPSWFSIMAMQSMYGNNFEELLKYRLEQLFNPLMLDKSPEALHESIVSEISNIYNETDPASLQDSPSFGATAFRIIGCYELTASSASSQFGFQFVDGKLATVPSTKKTCEGLDLSDAEIYDAKNYPIAVPVIYLQGLWDGATTVDDAIKHYKNVPKNSATLFIAKTAGHSPMIDMLNPYVIEPNDLSRALIQLFKDIVIGNKIDLSKVNALLPKTEQWVKTLRSPAQ